MTMSPNVIGCVPASLLLWEGWQPAVITVVRLQYVATLTVRDAKAFPAYRSLPGIILIVCTF